MAESLGEALKALFSTLWTVWAEMASIAWNIMGKILIFFLWALSGVIILPCVFIAGTLYPKWMEWGEDF